MPNFAIADAPIQVSQFLTMQGLLTNDGKVPIYLDTDSSVSPQQYGIRLLPHQSVNWSSGTLWGITDPGTSGLLAVQYGANTTVSPVTSIDGPVTATIEGPVEATILGTVDAVVTGTVDATVTGAVDATITGPVDATITGPVDAVVTGTVDVAHIQNVVATNVMNEVETTVTNQVATTVTNTVTADIANVVTVQGDVNATVTGDVNATIAGPVTVSGTVDAAITGPVTADISGPVTVSGISSPVNVQGGGEVLAVGTYVNRSFGSGQAVLSVPAPPDGLTYYGLRVAILITGIPASGNVAAVSFQVEGGITYEGSLVANNASDGVPAGTSGVPAQYHLFTLPMDAAYPLAVRSRVNGAGTLSYQIAVLGVSAAPPRITTDLARVLREQTNSPVINVPLSATIKYVYLPPSFTPYRVRLVTHGSSSITGSIYQEISNGATGGTLPLVWTNVVDRVHIPETYVLSPANVLPSTSVVSFQVPGSGCGGRLALLGTGTVSVSVHQID